MSILIATTEVPAGPVRVTFGFTGGSEPELTMAQVTAVGVRVAVDPGSAQRLVAALWDLEIDASGVAQGELLVRFGPGVEVAVPHGAEVRVRGSAAGPPHSLVLSGPLELSAGDAWLRLAGGNRLRWLSSLARVGVVRAVLHPDGRVALEGRGRRGLDRAVRRGLRHVSQQLSGLVRYSPRYQVLRDFLDYDSLPSTSRNWRTV